MSNDPFEKQRKKGNCSRTFEYLTKAAELGNAEANYTLSILFLFARRDRVKSLINAFKDGVVEKEALATSLRAHYPAEPAS
eukprot:scaffold8741_cov142-Skeletonema_menzelii.AAC.3